MILHCPECDAVIKAANINVQELAAVCQECDAVFNFDMADVGGKQKRRKYKAPSQLAVADTEDELTMRYRRVFNEEERGIRTRNGLFAVLLPILTIITFSVAAPWWIITFLALWAAASLYVQAALLFNTTTITLDDETLHVGKGPLPWITGAPNTTFNRAAIVDVTITETSASRQGNGIKRYHHVRVQQPDGDAITILPSLPQAYARYIAQELNTALASINEDNIDYAHLSDMADQLAVNIDDILASAGDEASDNLPGFLDGQADQADLADLVQK